MTKAKTIENLPFRKATSLNHFTYCFFCSDKDMSIILGSDPYHTALTALTILKQEMGLSNLLCKW